MLLHAGEYFRFVGLVKDKPAFQEIVPLRFTVLERQRALSSSGEDFAVGHFRVARRVVHNWHEYCTRVQGLRAISALHLLAPCRARHGEVVRSNGRGPSIAIIAGETRSRAMLPKHSFLRAALILGGACGRARTPRAAVWGYIDEQGRAHIATEKLDDRYQLFFKGPTTAEVEAAKNATPRLEPFVETPIFRRLESHPNVKRYEPLIARYAKEQNVDAALVKAMVAVESGYEPTAVSPKGALGLMQVIPETAARYGLADDAKRTVEQKLFDPATNLRIGTRYLRDLLELFAHDVRARARRVQRGRGRGAALRQPGAAVSRDAGVREARHAVLRAVQAAASAAAAVAHHRAATARAAALGRPRAPRRSRSPGRSRGRDSTVPPRRPR